MIPADANHVHFGKAQTEAEVTLAPGKHTLQLNLRGDDDSEFGSKGTGSVAYGYEFVPNWRATATF